MKKNINSGGSEFTVRGIITAADWGENDSITAVKISAIDEEEYLIENSDTFIPLVQQNIQATGILKESKDRILIKEYKIL